MRARLLVAGGVLVLAVAAVFVLRWVGDEEGTAESVSPTVEQNAELDSKTRREQQAARLSKLAKERGGLPIDQALAQAPSEKQREFAKKDMAYQTQTAEESRQHVLERLSEVEAELANTEEPDRIEQLKKQIEMLQKLAQKFD